MTTYRNLMITMVLGGLWHGAGWGFVAWGAIHGLYLVGERAMNGGSRPDSNWLPSWVVFGFVTLAWVPFRSGGLNATTEIMQSFLRPFEGTQLRFAPIALAILGLATVFIDNAILSGRINPVGHLPAIARGVVYAFALAIAFMFVSPFEVPFVYFQF